MRAHRHRWLIVEDLAMVLALVLLPVAADLLKGGEAAGAATLSDAFVPFATTLAKVAAFVALMLIVGRRVVPWGLHRIAGTGSRELFALAVLAISLASPMARRRCSGCPSRSGRSSPGWCWRNPS